MATTDKQSALDYINQMFPTVRVCFAVVYRTFRIFLNIWKDIIVDDVETGLHAEASLSGVEPLMQKIHSEIRRVDAEILTAVRQQMLCLHAALLKNNQIIKIEADILVYKLLIGSKAREELAAATHAVQELIYKMQEIKTKAEQSESMVQEICRDIKKLDFAKKHITVTITALHRLTMLVSAVEQLQVMASKRQYKEAAAQLEVGRFWLRKSRILPCIFGITDDRFKDKVQLWEFRAVNQLCSHFEAYRDFQKITELREKFKSIKQILKSHVFSDFSRSTSGKRFLNVTLAMGFSELLLTTFLHSLGTGKETEDSNLLQQLSEACLVVDALEPSVREDLVKNFCSRELTSYQQIFEGAGLSNFVVLYSYCLQSSEVDFDDFELEIWLYSVSAELAKLDKTERRYAWIKRRLRTNEEIWKIFPTSWHVSYLLCIQFCKLTRTQLVDILNNLKEKPDVGTLLLALQRTLEFEEELAEKFGGGSRSRESGSDVGEDTVENNHSVSDIRKKYEKKLAAHHGKVQKDLSVPGAGFNFRGIISSCFEPYLAVYVELEEKTLMEHLEKLVQEETWEIEEGSQTNILSSSMQVFQRILKAYATKLFARLPKGGTGIVAAATGMDGQIKTSDKDERLICELAENVSNLVDPQFADRIDMSEVQDEFSAVITKALITLVHGIETKFDAEMAAMTRVPWGTLESVGDQSEYVNGINTILSASIPVLGRLLSPIYFQFFLDKLASSLGPRFYLNIFKCKQISETGAQQMLLDTQAVKTILLEIPSLGKKVSAAAGYSKFVSREMSKAEALLKVILSPVDSVADTYCALLPEGTPSEFQRILDLKGLKRTDQQSILDDYNKRGAGTYQPSIKAVFPSTPSASSAPNQSTPAGIIPLKEEIVARAAALGRGAATTGIRRILALTESTTKDRKDGPLRKLFIG
ncbi:hypothetical protein DH2020_010634 [Rehmannia glutinosa]|uniref:Vps53 N-terminal domain-containing protein n=1 Tax=Rehmannia glutinosa TaxID=99300 RepID=A0ABR0XB83_REHGL